MGTRIYISSTFEDLEPYREAVQRALRKMQKEVVAMEDYVARDDRPLAACLADVETSDLYVGIFAWRYGFIPSEDNPDGRSITELEFRHAVAQGVPCLIFLLSEDVVWKPSCLDSHTGEGEAGRRISELRQELQEQRVAGFFESPDHLASLVQSAVSVSLDERRDDSAARREDIFLHPRELTHPHLIAYAEADRALVDRLVDAQPQGGLLLVPEPILFATDAADFERLEGVARRGECASVVLSPRTLNRFEENSEGSHKVLSLLRARTGCLDALCSDAASVDRAARSFPFDRLYDMSQLSTVDLARLLVGEAADDSRKIGLPYVIVAMTRSEAEQLDQQPELIEMALDLQARERFESLRQALSDHGHASLGAHYGERRESWRPFVSSAAGGDRPLEGLLGEVVDRLGSANRPQLRGRRLKPQLYPFDALVDQDPALRPIYGEIAEAGCLVIVDELSIYHPRISRAAMQLFGRRQVAVVTISPLDPRSLPPYALLERELSRSLGFAFDRFDRDLDPQCEVGVGDARQLKRWLFSNLPATASKLFEPEPARARLRSFARELELEDDRSLASELYSEGGGL